MALSSGSRLFVITRTHRYTPVPVSAQLHCRHDSRQCLDASAATCYALTSHVDDPHFDLSQAFSVLLSVPELLCVFGILCTSYRVMLQLTWRASWHRLLINNNNNLICIAPECQRLQRRLLLATAESDVISLLACC